MRTLFGIAFCRYLAIAKQYAVTAYEWGAVASARLTSSTLDSALTLLTILSTWRNESKRGSLSSGGSLYSSSSMASHSDAILLTTSEAGACLNPSGVRASSGVQDDETESFGGRFAASRTLHRLRGCHKAESGRIIDAHFRSLCASTAHC